MQALIIAQLIAFLVVVYFLYQKDTKDRELKESFFKQLTDNTNKFYESLEKIQIKHFQDLEKTSSKQLSLLEKNSKQFLDAIVEMKKTKVERISPIDIPSLENTIEKEETAEIPMTEDVRIPMTEGLKFQFEGEEEILDFNPQ